MRIFWNVKSLGIPLQPTLEIGCVRFFCNLLYEMICFKKIMYNLEIQWGRMKIVTWISTSDRTSNCRDLTIWSLNVQPMGEKMSLVISINCRDLLLLLSDCSCPLSILFKITKGVQCTTDLRLTHSIGFSSWLELQFKKTCDVYIATIQ